MKKTFTLIMAIGFLALSAYNLMAQTPEFDYKKLNSVEWNEKAETDAEKLPYHQYSDRNTGVAAFSVVDDKYFAYLCSSEKVVKLFHQTNNSYYKDIAIDFFANDFAYYNGNFYFISNQQVVVTDVEGNELNTYPFPDLEIIAASLAIENGKIFLQATNQSTYLIAKNGSYVGKKVDKHSYLANDIYKYVRLVDKKSCKITLYQNNREVFTDELKTDDELSAVFVHGMVDNSLIIETETYNSANNKYNRTLKAIAIDNGKFSEVKASTILPNTYYTYVKRQIAISANTIYYLVSAPSSADLFKFSFGDNKKSGQVKLNELYEEYNYNNHLLDYKEPETIIKGKIHTRSSISRSTIINNALPYTTHVWTASSSNRWTGQYYGGWPVYSVGWANYNGSNNVGIPYKWGGFNNITSFDNGLGTSVSGSTKNKSAGDTYCSNSKSARACAVGVDCSGYVSLAWQLSSHIGTGNLWSYSKEYRNNENKKDYRQLLPGDILLKNGHVMLVRSLNENGSINVLEARSGDWKAIAWTYTAAQVSDYSPRYYNNVKKFDLRIASDISVSPKPMKRNNPVEVVVYIKNYGNEDYKGKIACAVHNLDGTYKGDISPVNDVELKAGYKYKLTFKNDNLKISAGNYKLFVKVFPEDGTWYDIPKGSYSNGISVKIEEGTGGGTSSGYCEAKGSSQKYEWIQGVKFYGETTLDNNSGKTGGYKDFTSKSFKAVAGKSYQLKLYPGFSSGTYTEAWKVWIDANQDGQFSASEEVFAKKSKSTISDYFKIPSNAKQGNTRIRVAMNYNNYPNACGTFSYGEVEDYTINIQNGGSDNASNNFYIDNQSVNPTSFKTNESFTVSCKHKYQGNSSEKLYVKVGYYISTKKYYDNSAIYLGDSESSLYKNDTSDGEEEAFSVPSSINVSKDTPYYILLIADYNNKFAETDENNLKYVKVTIKSSGSDDDGGTNNSDYCKSEGKTQNFEWIQRVIVKGETTLDNNSGKNGGYEDFTNKSFKAKAGKSYAIEFQPGFSSGSYNEAWKAWIDCNHDGQFSASEEVYAKKSSNTITGYLKIPSNSKSGATCMRIVMSYGSYESNCGVYSYGETEDYTIIIENGGGSNDDNNNYSYCDVSGEYQSYEWIKRIKISGESTIDNSSGKEGYANYTNILFNAKAGKSYPVILYPGFNSSAYNEAWKIWIDANQDSQFSASEEVFAKKSSGTISGYFKVPDNAKSGKTRLRIVMQYNNYASSCGSFQYGEAEDYSINISGNSKKTANFTTSQSDFENSFALYPNPAKDVLNIELKNQEQIKSVRIVDLSGKHINHYKFDAKEKVEVNINHLDNGMYVIYIETIEAIYETKFIVNK